MLIIDNYDSFTYNIVQYIRILEIEPIVIKNDELCLDEIRELNFSRIILSPGWGNPENSGVTMQVIEHYKDKLPILGVCLGMQCIAKYFGAEIVKAPEPYHGKNSKIFFERDFELFKGMLQGFSATRYHSLMVNLKPTMDCHVAQIETAPRNDLSPVVETYHNCEIAKSPDNTLNQIQITAWTEEKIPMALKIKDKPIFGVQFHPEAILTENGIEVFRNFIEVE